MGLFGRNEQSLAKGILGTSGDAGGGGGGKGAAPSADSFNYNPKTPWKGQKPVPQVKTIPLELIKRSIS